MYDEIASGNCTESFGKKKLADAFADQKNSVNVRQDLSTTP